MFSNYSKKMFTLVRVQPGHCQLHTYVNMSLIQDDSLDIVVFS